MDDRQRIAQAKETVQGVHVASKEKKKLLSLPYAVGACKKRVGLGVREGRQQGAASASLWKQEGMDLINYGCAL